MSAYYTNKEGKKELIWMGCYGIGLQRLMATIVEVYHDERGIVWPEAVSPYKAHLIEFKMQKSKGKMTKQNSKLSENKVYEELQEAGIDVLFDDREGVQAGQKFSDADLIGIPVRLVISQKSGDKIEWKERNKEKTELLSVEEVIGRLKTD